MTKQELAKEILGCKNVEQLPQKGNRNCGIFVSIGEHRFSDKFERVSCKFYKGDGTTKGFAEGYMPFHQRDFAKIPELKNPLIQQSLECGIWENAQPYSVFQFIEGKMLRDVVGNKDNPITTPTLSIEQAKSILTDMFCNVWIPLWLAGIRFRDGHTGNWVLGEDGKAYMIDTEQMRKDAVEFLYNPTSWTQRDKHEKSCLKLVHGIFADFSNACEIKITDSSAKKILANTNLLQSLSTLGRTDFSKANAIAEFEKTLKKFFEK